jgi:hypothetical protein
MIMHGIMYLYLACVSFVCVCVCAYVLCVCARNTFITCMAEAQGGGSVRKRSEGSCVAASTRLATRNRAVGAVRAGGRVAALAATKRTRRRMASLSDTSAEEEEEEEEGSG